MKNIKIIISASIIILLLSACTPSQEQASDIYRITPEDKIYEFSVIWKELSYNFANMDNCPGVNMDNLYKSYIPIILNTENDFEYCRAVQRFLANFNNGHVYCEYPDYIQQELGYFPIITSCKNNKLLIENIWISDTNNFSIGDEIIQINNIPALEYVEQYMLPYVAASNEDVKMERAMFGNNYYANLLQNDYLELVTKNEQGTHKQTLYSKRGYDITSSYAKKDIAITGNLFLEDSVLDVTYIRLIKCDSSFDSFFLENYDKILKYDNLIIDISSNGGGDGNIVFPILSYLINNDSIYTYNEKTRINNALHKAWATIKILYYEDHEVPQFHKMNYYPYYYDTAFGDIFHNNGLAKQNHVSDSKRYKGNIYVIIGTYTGSAAEYFAAMLSQNKKVTSLGKKTAGAFGQPLVISLPSRMRVFINTTKTYDFHGTDMSSGFSPDYEYDFSEFYKTENPDEMLGKFVNIIQKLEKIRNRN